MYAPFIIERLRVGLEQLADDVNDILYTMVLPQYRDFVAENIQYINDKIIEPILQSNDTEIHPNFQNAVIPFALKIASVNAIILESQQNNLSKFAELDQTFYDKILQIIRDVSSEIGTDSSAKIAESVKRLMDYENVLLGIVMKRPAQLAEALKEVDINDLIKSVYGTLLALACIFAILKEQRYNDKKIKIFVDLTEEYSATIEPYADTIDIISNPEEMELLKRSEQE